MHLFVFSGTSVLALTASADIDSRLQFSLFTWRKSQPLNYSHKMGISINDLIRLANGFPLLQRKNKAKAYILMLLFVQWTGLVAKTALGLGLNIWTYLVIMYGVSDDVILFSKCFHINKVDKMFKSELLFDFNNSHSLWLISVFVYF